MTIETINKRLKDYQLKTGKSITRIASESNLSLANLYKWVKGTKISDPEDYRKLESYLNFSEGKIPKLESKELENIPQSTLLNDPSESYNKDKKPINALSDTALARLDKLIDANHMLSRANMDLSETTVILARKSSSGAPNKSGAVFLSNRNDFLESLATDLSKDGTFHTSEEAVLILDKILNAIEKGVSKEDKPLFSDKLSKTH